MAATTNNISGKIIFFFTYLRIIFGLQVVSHTQKQGFLINTTVQRCLACFWFCLYFILALSSRKPEYTSELQIRKSLLIRLMPIFISKGLFICMTLTLLFTHTDAGKRKKIKDEILKMDKTVDIENISVHPKAATVAILQLFYISFWFFLTGPLQYYKNSTSLERFIGIVPRFVSTFFLLDYFTAIAFLMQQFIKNNKSLNSLREVSLQTKHYPIDEKLFQQQIIEISQRHRELSKLVGSTNRIYALLLLVNIVLLYAIILGKTYIAVYALFSPLEIEAKIKIAFVNFVQLFVNAATLLLLVEITSGLCEEVRRD